MDSDAELRFQLGGITTTIPTDPETANHPAGPSFKTNAERKAILTRRVVAEVSSGKRIESQTDMMVVLVNGRRVNHWLHFFIGVCTLGLWWFVWALLAITGGEQRQVISVDDYGNLSSLFPKGQALAPIQAEALPRKGFSNAMNQGKAERIDAEWYAVMPNGWGTFDDGGMHSGERKMLHTILGDDESIEALVGGLFRQDTDRMAKHTGVAVATNKRVVFVDKGLFGSTETMELPYRSIEGVTSSTGMISAGIQITGRGAASYRIENVKPKDAVRTFSEVVRRNADNASHEGPQKGPVERDAASIADEIAKLSDLNRQGILTDDEFNKAKQKVLGI